MKPGIGDGSQNQEIIYARNVAKHYEHPRLKRGGELKQNIDPVSAPSAGLPHAYEKTDGGDCAVCGEDWDHPKHTVARATSDSGLRSAVPSGSSAEDWQLWLAEWADASLPFKAVQIAIAIDAAFERGKADQRPPVSALSDDEARLIVARVIGETAGIPNHIERARQVIAALDEARAAAALRAGPAGEEPGVTCERCQGNGEIVTDWDRYRHPHDGDKGDEAVAECPDCNGIGTVDRTAPAGVSAIERPERIWLDRNGMWTSSQWLAEDHGDGYGTFPEYVRADLVDATAPAEGVAVPAGWKLVPVEPTQEMLRSAQFAFSVHNAEQAAKVYAAMLTAAPPTADAGEPHQFVTTIGEPWKCSICGKEPQVHPPQPIRSIMFADDVGEKIRAALDKVIAWHEDLARVHRAAGRHIAEAIEERAVAAVKTVAAAILDQGIPLPPETKRPPE